MQLLRVVIADGPDVLVPAREVPALHAAARRVRHEAREADAVAVDACDQVSIVVAHVAALVGTHGLVLRDVDWNGERLAVQIPERCSGQIQCGR